MNAHSRTQKTQRAIAARCVVVGFAFASASKLAMPASALRTPSLQPWSIGNDYEGDSQPGEVSV